MVVMPFERDKSYTRMLYIFWYLSHFQKRFPEKVFVKFSFEVDSTKLL